MTVTGAAGAAPVTAHGSGAGCRLRRVELRVVAEVGAEVRLDGLLPLTGVDHLRDGLVDLLAGVLVALLKADAVLLLGEGIADELELALVGILVGVAGEDRVVRRHRVDGAGGERVRALGVLVVLLGDEVRLLLLQVVDRRRAGDGADLLAREVLDALDVAVRLRQDRLAGDEVGAAEGDLLLALVGDRVRGEDHLDGARLEHLLTLLGGRLDEVDLVLAVAHLLRDVLGDVDVEALVVRAGLESEAGLVVLDADLDLVARAGRALVVAAATGRQAEGEGGDTCGGDGTLHVCFLLGLLTACVSG